MGKEIITCEKSVQIGRVTLIPLVKLSLACMEIQGKLSFHGIKQPSHMIVLNESGIKTYRITGEEISIEQLQVECPVLDTVLAEYSGLPLPSG